MFWRMGDWMEGSETLCSWYHQIRLRRDVGVDGWWLLGIHACFGAWVIGWKVLRPCACDLISYGFVVMLGLMIGGYWEFTHA